MQDTLRADECQPAQLPKGWSTSAIISLAGAYRSSTSDFSVYLYHIYGQNGDSPEVRGLNDGSRRSQIVSKDLLCGGLRSMY